MLPMSVETIARGGHRLPRARAASGADACVASSLRLRAENGSRSLRPLGQFLLPRRLFGGDALRALRAVRPCRRVRAPRAARSTHSLRPSRRRGCRPRSLHEPEHLRVRVDLDDLRVRGASSPCRAAAACRTARAACRARARRPPARSASWRPWRPGSRADRTRADASRERVVVEVAVADGACSSSASRTAASNASAMITRRRRG